MLCKVCGTEMSIGKFIDDGDAGEIYVAPRGLLTSVSMEIKECYKCPECGHSERI